MMLSDRDILHAIECEGLAVDPFSPNLLQPASLDVRLGHEFRIPGYVKSTFVGPMVMSPGRFVLGHTLETVKIPSHLAVRVEGKSTWGRQGLQVHLTAGFIDPGFEGQITLELHNAGQATLRLERGMPIAQLSFHRLSSPALRPYGSAELGSHYQGQTGPTAPYTWTDPVTAYRAKVGL